MDEQSGYCQGCARSIEEIAGWGSLSRRQKVAILDQLDERFFSINPIKD